MFACMWSAVARASVTRESRSIHGRDATSAASVFCAAATSPRRSRFHAWAARASPISGLSGYFRSHSCQAAWASTSLPEASRARIAANSASSATTLRFGSRPAAA